MSSRREGSTCPRKLIVTCMFSGRVQVMRARCFTSGAIRVRAACARTSLTGGGRPMPMKSLIADRIVLSVGLREWGRNWQRQVQATAKGECGDSSLRSTATARTKSKSKNKTCSIGQERLEVEKRVSPLRSSQKRELNPNEQVRSLGTPFAPVEMTIPALG